MTDWQHEFIGLFWGEGCLDVQIWHHNKKPNILFYRPRARIGQNIKNEACLKEIKNKLGGWLEYDKRNNALWRLQGKRELLNLIAILNEAVMYSAKKEELHIFKQIVELMPVKGKHYTPEQRKELANLTQQLRQEKKS